MAIHTYHHNALPWISPLTAAASVAHDDYWCLLYSADSTHTASRYSYLACDPIDIIEGNDFSALNAQCSIDQPCYDNAWFGYMGYELKNTLHDLPKTAPSIIALPPLHMVKYRTILVFDHHKKQLDCYCIDSSPPQFFLSSPPSAQHLMLSDGFYSLERPDYLDAINATIDHIHAGDFYQANITVKHYAQMQQHQDFFATYLGQCQSNPAPYSAFIKMKDTAILSASPECFLSCDAQGNIISRPIKGTAAKGDNAAKDTAQQKRLLRSAKDKAENLMIVDLMRNDLSRACDAGSIKTEALYQLESFAHVHHLVSAVSGKRAADKTTLDVIKACFPPGSMTGTPKIAAMRWISEIEKMDRGVYSGTIGMLGGDGSAQLNVVIRTMIMQHATDADGTAITRIQRQAGGGIVADSVAEDEWQEMQVKLGG